MTKKVIQCTFIIVLIIGIFNIVSFSAQKTLPKKASQEKLLSTISLDELMTHVEKQYFKKAFSVRFLQESSLKAMQITDKANGIASFKHPGMMWWKYETPEEQYIITNGDDLWIYRPEDNQVMVGKSPDYFGKGKGASFLTNIQMLREAFDISWVTDHPEAPPQNDSFYRIQLIPKKNNPDFTVLFLSIDKKTYHIHELVTLNGYNDRTWIQFQEQRFLNELKNDRFTFSIPEKADVVQF